MAGVGSVMEPAFHHSAHPRHDQGRPAPVPLGASSIDVGPLQIPPELLSRIPAAYARSRQLLPYAFERGVLSVAVADPLALEAMDELAFVTGAELRLATVDPESLGAAIDRHYGGAAMSPREDPIAMAAGAAADGDADVADAPVIRMVERLLTEALRRGASDIHLEPLEARLRLRYRIDGSLVEVEAPPARWRLAVVSRIKIMANLSIAEKRLPQDGRLQFTADGQTVDLRVSSLPTAHGESLMMRVLDQSGLSVDWPELGFLPDHQRLFARAIGSPDGIMLVTGPTGSGKTTTLYTALRQLNQTDRKIITVEEPVEYQLPGINQVPVNHETGLTFATALRAMLRQAPNVVMVGEIRDRETADTALQAALTGHLVLSTLHTNDAPSAITRLVDLGAKPFLIAAALRSVVAQRLVRRICPACRHGYRPRAHELVALGVSAEQAAGAEFYRGAGCADCHGTGYRGRMGLFEVLPVSEELRTLIYANVTASRLRAAARREGGRSLRADGVRKVLAGATTIEEVVAVTAGDPL